MYNKYVAGILAIVLGAPTGAHDFYLGRKGRAVAQMSVFWGLVFLLGASQGEAIFGLALAVASLIPFVTGVLFLTMPQVQFDQKFNREEIAATDYSVAVHADPMADLPDLKQEGLTYFKSGDYDLAAEAFQDAVKISPGDPKLHFNLACCYSCLHDPLAAYHHLELSISHGLTVVDRIDTHPALAWLRKQPSFADFRANNFRRRDYRQQNQSASPEPEMELMDLNAPIMAVEATDELLDKLTKLGDLRERGILTDREFAQRKARLLGD